MAKNIITLVPGLLFSPSGVGLGAVFFEEIDLVDQVAVNLLYVPASGCDDHKSPMIRLSDLPRAGDDIFLDVKISFEIRPK